MTYSPKYSPSRSAGAILTSSARLEDMIIPRQTEAAMPTPRNSRLVRSFAWAIGSPFAAVLASKSRASVHPTSATSASVIAPRAPSRASARPDRKPAAAPPSSPRRPKVVSCTEPQPSVVAATMATNAKSAIVPSQYTIRASRKRKSWRSARSSATAARKPSRMDCRGRATTLRCPAWRIGKNARNGIASTSNQMPVAAEAARPSVAGSAPTRAKRASSASAPRNTKAAMKPSPTPSPLNRPTPACPAAIASRLSEKTRDNSMAT